MQRARWGLLGVVAWGLLAMPVASGWAAEPTASKVLLLVRVAKQFLDEAQHAVSHAAKRQAASCWVAHDQ